jgi:hypothetical protein
MSPSLSPSHNAARLGALAVAAVAACLLAAPAQAAVTSCTGTLSGVTVDELVVPSGASCTLANVTVLGNVMVRPTGSLDAPSTTVHIGGSVDVRDNASFVASTSSTMDTGGLLTVGGSIRALTGSTLDIFTKNFEIGGAVRAQGADSVVLAPVPWTGASAAIGDLVTVLWTENVWVGGAEVGGNVRVVGSGNSYGVQVGGNDVDGSIVVINSAATAPPVPTVFAIFGNTVAGDVVFSNNDTTGTIEPPLIGSNTIGGSLVCWNNVPAHQRPARGPVPQHRGREQGRAVLGALTLA